MRANIVVAIVAATVLGMSGHVIDGMLADLEMAKTELSLLEAKRESQPPLLPVDQDKLRTDIDFYLSMAERSLAAGDRDISATAGLAALREAHTLYRHGHITRDEYYTIHDKCWLFINPPRRP